MPFGIGHPPTYTSNLVYMCAGGFRGPKSSNRIELSQFWCFGLPAALGVGGGWMGVGGGWVVPPTHVGGARTCMHMHTCAHAHMHMHTCTCTHAHACVVNMIISCKWPPPLGESLGIPYDVICVCTCMHVCVCMHVHVHVCGVHPLTTPHPIHPPPIPQGGTPGISQNSIALELIEIFQFHLKI